MPIKRVHSVDDLPSNLGDPWINPNVKKQRRHKNKKDNHNSLQSSHSQPLSQPLSSNQLLANSSVVDDVLDAVAYSTNTNELNDADEITVPATDHSEPNEQQAPGALGTMMSLCMKTHIVPVSTAIAALQEEVKQLKDLVAKLTVQVCDMSAAITGIIGNQSQSLQSTTLPHSDQSSQQAINQTIPSTRSTPSYSAAAASTQHMQGRLRQSQEAQRDAVTRMYVDLDKKQRRASNIVVSGLASDNPPEDDAKVVIKLLCDEYE